MSETQERVVELLERYHQGLRKHLDQARLLILRIEVLDDIRGVDTMKAVLKDPFPGVRRGAETVSAPNPPPASAKPKKNKTVKRDGPTIVELAHQVLKSYPSRWFNINALISEIKRDGGRTLNRSSVQGELIKLTNKKTPWLARKKAGRTALYSFVANQNAKQQNDKKPPSGIIL